MTPRRALAAVSTAAVLLGGSPRMHAEERDRSVPDAEMLLDLDLLSDESFDAHTRAPVEQRLAEDAELLDRLDWFDQDEPRPDARERRR